MAGRAERPHGIGPHPVAGGVFAEHGPDPALVGDCVHCGFCLPTCPTYVLWGDEADSPRGRIYLMREGIEGAPPSPALYQHLDACLGCMACLTACPSGVRYDRLIEEARAVIEPGRPSRRERLQRRLIFSLFPYRRRLAPLAVLLAPGWRTRLLEALRISAVGRRLPAPLPAMLEVAPVVRREAPVAAFTPASGPRRGRVGLLVGCVQGAFFPAVNAATVRVLAAEGFDVVAPAAAGCCGALSSHSGRKAEAQRFARALIAAFEAAELDAIVVNAAGCGSAMKEYAELLADEPPWAARAAALSSKVRDVAEFLAGIEPVAPRHPLPITVAYHDACHLAHAQQIVAEPRLLLDAIPGLRRVELAEPELCCGSAGVYNLLQPAAASALGDRKAANVARAEAELLVAANPGCTMQIAAALRRAGSEMASAHTIEVLDASIRGSGAETLTATRR
ncbi:MAG TPA: heterodisulfide reductase-related iron-sulfur binding cluster [Acidimicrobiales bacterium]|nr:heterodisulfide reductase-related iron-sulfur binding cluster [Acidimicrobiales bacterium]